MKSILLDTVRGGKALLSAFIQEYLRKANISYKTSKKGICSSNRCDIVKVLLKVGANVDATDSFGRTALMYEVLSKAINIAKL